MQIEPIIEPSESKGRYPRYLKRFAARNGWTLYGYGKGFTLHVNQEEEFLQIPYFKFSGQVSAARWYHTIRRIQGTDRKHFRDDGGYDYGGDMQRG